jgi:HEAT repeat protein
MGQGKHRTEETFKRLISFNPDERDRALEEIERIGELALPQIHSFVLSDKRGPKDRAIHALGKIHNSQSIPVLIKLLLDPNLSEKDRQLAAWSIGEFRDPSTVPHLAKAINTCGQLDNIGWEAILALEKIATDEAFCVILNTVINMEQDDAVQEGAALSLGRIQNPQAVPFLIQAMRHSGGKHHSGTMIACWKAIDGMGETAAPELEALLGHEEFKIQEAAAELLKEIGTPDAMRLYHQWKENAFANDE